MESYRPSLGSVEYHDHTADLWVKATGSNRESAIGHLVHGIYGVMAESFDLIERTEDFMVGSEGPDIETAMVDLLNELLFHFDAESRIIIDPEIRIENDEKRWMIHMSGRGRIVEIPQGKSGMEVKAVTYHGASIQIDEGKAICRILLDL